jgi:RNA polymerase sigma-70 factor (ECF subfamily)
MPDEESALEETAAQLRVALDSLSDEQREAFLLQQESGLTLEQIARVVGVGRETIKSRLRYAVTNLRSRLVAESA